MARDLDAAMADQPDVPVSVLYLRFLGWLGPRSDPDNPPEATRVAELPPSGPTQPPTSRPPGRPSSRPAQPRITPPPERPRARPTEDEFDEPTQ
jgi:hypothetical protein